MTLAGQTAVSYDYDAADRLTTITQGSTAISYTYNDAGLALTTALPNGIVATYSYDDAGRLTSIEYALGATPIGDLAYTIDRAGRRAVVEGSLARTVLPAELSSSSYNAANRLTDWDSTSLTYDLGGNLTSDGTNSYTWNARNELVSVSGGASAAFSYDSFGRRASKTVNGTTSGYAFDGANYIQEQDASGTPTADLLTGGIDRSFSRSGPGGQLTYLTDGLGSTLALADDSGTVQASYTYGPFGATTLTGTDDGNAQEFTGRENDGTGLYYYRARYYHPGFGRFISEDPLGFAAGDPNLYAYAGNDPINASDPSGMFVPIAGMCAVGAAIDIGITLAEDLAGRKVTFNDYLASGVSGCIGGIVGGSIGKLLFKAFGPAVVRLAGLSPRLNALIPRLAQFPAFAQRLSLLYRVADRYPGGTAGILRIEFALKQNLTRNPNGHIIKAIESVNGISSYLDDLGPLDASLARAVIEDLARALADIL